MAQLLVAFRYSNSNSTIPFSAADVALSKTLMAEWASFARAGTPSSRWPTFTPRRECIRRYAAPGERDEDAAADDAASCGAAASVTPDLNERCRYIVDEIFHGNLLAREDAADRVGEDFSQLGLFGIFRHIFDILCNLISRLL